MKKVFASILTAASVLMTTSGTYSQVVSQPLAQTRQNSISRPVQAQPQVDPYTQMVQQEEAREAEKRRTMSQSYETCLQAAQYMSTLERIQAAHIQSCQCLLQGQRGVVSPAGDFMGCDPRSLLLRTNLYAIKLHYPFPII